jgi:two-component system, NarL family, invasion response regulator UvrY
MRILLVDDHAVVRKGVIDILSTMTPPPQFTEAVSSREALDHLAAASDAFDFVVLDLHLPDESGFETLHKIRETFADLPVLILSMYDAAEYAMRALKAGANGYVTKGSVPEDLRRAIEAVECGKTFVSEHLVEQMLAGMGDPRESVPTVGLSEREATVLRLLALGQRVNVIGDQLGLSPKTVATYRARVLAKLGLKSNADLVRYAYKTGVLRE